MVSQIASSTAASQIIPIHCGLKQQQIFILSAPSGIREQCIHVFVAQDVSRVSVQLSARTAVVSRSDQGWRICFPSGTFTWLESRCWWLMEGLFLAVSLSTGLLRCPHVEAGFLQSKHLKDTRVETALSLMPGSWNHSISSAVF